MARPREFDTDQALTQAMHVFWLNGYHATTTRDLDTRLGIGHQSLYNAFGNKASLFRSVLRHYEIHELGPRLETLEKQAASKRDIVRFVAQMVDFFDTPPPRKGCLMTNVALLRMHEDADVATLLNDFIARLGAAFLHALETGIALGEIDSGIDVTAVRRSLLCMVMGLGVAARTGAEREMLVDMASTALRPLY